MNRFATSGGGYPRRALIRHRASLRLVLLLLLTLSLLLGSSPLENIAEAKGKEVGAEPTAEDYLVVDCLLPGKVRRLGRRSNYITPRRPVRTTALDCQIRGGEYTEFDRASYESALKVWLDEAKTGAAEAQYYVAQIYEKGLGIEPDYPSAAEWYAKAAEQGHSAAQMSLGYLYETGMGVAQDQTAALNWYRKASGLPDEMIVLEGDEYRQLVGVREELDRKSQEVERLQQQLSELQRQLQEKKQEGAKETQLQEQVKRLEKELEAGQLAVSQYKLRLAGLEEEVVSTTAPEPVRAASQTPAPLPKSLDFGPYNALVIGNRSYQRLEVLDEAVTDAQTVATLLEQRYGFKVRRLYDANRYDILSALNQLREELTERHNLLVYYVGHSVRDRDTQRSWWQPIDAEPDNRANWISTRVMNDHLDLIPAKHILVVADAAYSGTLTRSAIPRLPQGMSQEKRAEYIKQILEKRSRLVMASGEGPSDFSDLLVDILGGNDQVVEASTLHLQLVERMRTSSRTQVPEFAPIRWTRAEGGGDFFFVPRRPALAAGS